MCHSFTCIFENMANAALWNKFVMLNKQQHEPNRLKVEIPVFLCLLHASLISTQDYSILANWLFKYFPRLIKADWPEWWVDFFCDFEFSVAGVHRSQLTLIKPTNDTGSILKHYTIQKFLQLSNDKPLFWVESCKQNSRSIKGWSISCQSENPLGSPNSRSSELHQSWCKSEMTTLTYDLDNNDDRFSLLMLDIKFSASSPPCRRT